MRLLTLATTIFVLFSSTGLHAELVNDFNCELKEGYTVPKLFEFQKEWMSAAQKANFDSNYRTRILFPLYNEITGTNPQYFIWRGFFKDGEQWGRMTDWFTTSVWQAKFDEVMNCSKSSLWIAPI